MTTPELPEDIPDKVAFDDAEIDEDAVDYEPEPEWSRPHRGGRGRPPRVVPASFSALVLFLTVSTGLGVAAGLIAGPGSIPAATTKVPVNPNGTGNLTGNGSGPPPGCCGTPINTTNPNGSGNSSSGNNTQGNQTSNQTNPPPNNNTGNGTGNGTGGNNTGNGTGNQTGNHTGGNSTGGNGSGNNGTANRSQNQTNATSPGSGGGVNNTTLGARNELPWLPVTERLAVLAGGFVGLGGLATAVLLESLAPRVASDDAWARSETRPRRHRRLRPRVDPKRAIGSAVAKLRDELERFGYESLDAGTSADVRDKIVRLYGELLASVGAGVDGLASRTPREIERICVERLEVTAATAHELTWLFEEARYSHHPMGAPALDRARRALGALVIELRRYSRSL